MADNEVLDSWEELEDNDVCSQAYINNAIVTIIYIIHLAVYVYS